MKTVMDDKWLKSRAEAIIIESKDHMIASELTREFQPIKARSLMFRTMIQKEYQQLEEAFSRKLHTAKTIFDMKSRQNKEKGWEMLNNLIKSR
jgi:hypothetical protein